MSFTSFSLKARLGSFGAQRRSPEPAEESAQEVDEKLPVKGDVVEAEVTGKLEDPTLAPGELTYDEGTHGAQLRYSVVTDINTMQRRPEGWAGTSVSSLAPCSCASQYSQLRT